MVEWRLVEPRGPRALLQLPRAGVPHGPGNEFSSPTAAHSRAACAPSPVLSPPARCCTRSAAQVHCCQ
eukprot:13327373-Alexandrium_andersonii.AAC.1